MSKLNPPKIKDVLAKYNQEEVSQLMKQARQGSDRAEGIQLPSYVYKNASMEEPLQKEVESYGKTVKDVNFSNDEKKDNTNERTTEENNLADYAYDIKSEVIAKSFEQKRLEKSKSDQDQTDPNFDILCYSWGGYDREEEKSNVQVFFDLMMEKIAFEKNKPTHFGKENTQRFFEKALEETKEDLKNLWKEMSPEEQKEIESEFESKELLGIITHEKSEPLKKPPMEFHLIDSKNKDLHDSFQREIEEIFQVEKTAVVDNPIVRDEDFQQMQEFFEESAEAFSSKEKALQKKAEMIKKREDNYPHLKKEMEEKLKNQKEGIKVFTKEDLKKRREEIPYQEDVKVIEGRFQDIEKYLLSNKSLKCWIVTQQKRIPIEKSSSETNILQKNLYLANLNFTIRYEENQHKSVCKKKETIETLKKIIIHNYYKARKNNKTLYVHLESIDNQEFQNWRHFSSIGSFDLYKEREIDLYIDDLTNEEVEHFKNFL